MVGCDHSGHQHLAKVREVRTQNIATLNKMRLDVTLVKEEKCA